jgi:hypothetical protein
VDFSTEYACSGFVFDDSTDVSRDHPGGLAGGVIPRGGIGLLDTMAVQPLPIGSRFTETQLAIPFGPVTGETTTSWLPDIVGVTPPPLGSIYFGANAASHINNNGSSTEDTEKKKTQRERRGATKVHRRGPVPAKETGSSISEPCLVFHEGNARCHAGNVLV